MKRHKGGPEDDARENLVDRGRKENSSMILRRFPTYVAVGCNEPNWLELHVERSHVMG